MPPEKPVCGNTVPMSVHFRISIYQLSKQWESYSPTAPTLCYSVSQIAQQNIFR